MEVGRVQVELDPEADPGPRPGAVVPARVGNRLGRGQQRQRLLREHLLELARRDPEPIDPQRQRVEIIAGELPSLEPRAAIPARVLRAPPIPRPPAPPSAPPPPPPPRDAPQPPNRPPRA